MTNVEDLNSKKPWWKRLLERKKPNPPRIKWEATIYVDGVMGGYIIQPRCSWGSGPRPQGFDEAPYGGKLAWHQREGIAFIAEIDGEQT